MIWRLWDHRYRNPVLIAVVAAAIPWAVEGGDAWFDFGCRSPASYGRAWCAVPCPKRGPCPWRIDEPEAPAEPLEAVMKTDRPLPVFDLRFEEPSSPVEPLRTAARTDVPQTVGVTASTRRPLDPICGKRHRHWYTKYGHRRWRCR